MSTVTNLTKKQIENIQIDESLIFINYGEKDERLLAPTRGGGEFTATVTVRDIEFDGRSGKTAGTQVIEEQGASLKVTTLCMSQENLALAVPGTVIEGNDKVIENPSSGVIPLESYLKNITIFARLIGGGFKKITIYNPMHETGFTSKAVQKSEGELAYEFLAHFPYSDLNGKGKLWRVEDVANMPTVPKDEAAAAQTADNKADTTK